jgi:class 3 adenylate cyclase
VLSMSTNQLSQLISGIPLFDGVSSAALRVIDLSLVQHYTDGDELLARGADAKSLIIMIEGEVCIFVEDTFLVSRRAPAVLGEQAFIDEVERSASVKAQGFVKALVIPKPIVQELMKDHGFIRNLLRVVSCKLRESTDERARHFKREKLLFGEFKAHLSEHVINSLLATGLEYGQPRHIEDAVILFSDIRSFTQRSAGMSAEEIAQQLSPYLNEIVEVIHRYEGLVDKFIGDAVMAVWGFTVNDEKVVQAFECAKEMILVASRMSFGGESIKIGVGLNTGPVFMGNVGGDRKRQFTVLGKPVNLASRFESESKTLNSPIVIGEEFFKLLPTGTRDRLTAHFNQSINGDEPQTLYTIDPLKLK